MRVLRTLLALFLAILCVGSVFAQASIHPRVYLPLVMGSGNGGGGGTIEPTATPTTEPTASPIASPQPTPTATPTTETTDNMASRLELINKVNKERTAVGCPAFEIDDALMAGAQAWSPLSRGDHSEGSDWYEGVYGYTGYFIGENIGSGTNDGTPALMVEGWMNSPIHAALITDCTHATYATYHVGAGAALEAGSRWVLAVGKKACDGTCPEN